MKKSRKIVIFHFLENFCTTGSKNDEKWLKKQKMIKKMIKTWFKNDKKMIPEMIKKNEDD